MATTGRHETLRARFGLALQRARNNHGISQTALAEKAGLSPKYVGEIERGEANVSIDVQERLCVALDWYPFELWVTQQESLPEGARTVLSATLQNIGQLAQTGARTLAAMESEAVTAARAGLPPKPKRGRPRRVLHTETRTEFVPAVVHPELIPHTEPLSDDRHEIAAE